MYSDAGKPLARCSALVDCGLEMIDNAPWFHLEVTLRTSGRVSAFLFAGRSILPQQGLNADLLAAHEIGIETREIALVRVD
ncbi:MAG: hypothetical protein H7138_01445 [Myxococcales bacterium]|nr:hypothetical protein [Myxococcales bacterium]